MADAADIAGDNIDEDLARMVAATKSDIPPGSSGECILCGEWNGRIIRGACSPCRDRYGLD